MLFKCSDFRIYYSNSLWLRHQEINTGTHLDVSVGIHEELVSVGGPWGAGPVHSIKAFTLTLIFFILDLFSNYFIHIYPFSSTPPQSLHGQEFCLSLLIALMTSCVGRIYANSQGILSNRNSVEHSTYWAFTMWEALCFKLWGP